MMKKGLLYVYNTVAPFLYRHEGVQKKMSVKSSKNSLLLFVAAIIWGVAFVAQSAGMDYVGPFTFNAVRSLLGGVVLIPCVFLLNRINNRQTVQRTVPCQKTGQRIYS